MVGRFTSGVGLLCVLVSPACGGIGAGDYAIYRVATRQAVVSGDCSNDDNDSSSLLSSSSYVLYVAGGESDTPLLDLDGIVLAGVEIDDGYDFSGEQVDREEFGGQTITDSDHDGIDDSADPEVDADQDGMDDKLDDPEVDVDGDLFDDRFADDLVDANGDGVDDNIVSLDGDTLVTTLKIAVQMTIDGQTTSGTISITTQSACDGECNNFEGSSCTATSNFVGVELEDAVVDVPN